MQSDNACFKLVAKDKISMSAGMPCHPLNVGGQNLPISISLMSLGKAADLLDVVQKFGEAHGAVLPGGDPAQDRTSGVGNLGRDAQLPQHLCV